MTTFRAAGLAAMLCLGLTSTVNAGTINFKELADAPVGPGELGESAWSTLTLTPTGFTVSITGTLNGSAAYAYLDSGNAGLGVCQNLDGSPAANMAHPGSTANLCLPSSDDNVRQFEKLSLVFNTNVVIGSIWFNNNHDTDFSLLGNTINIGGSNYTFGGADGPNGSGDFLKTGPYSVAANTPFNIEWVDEQFYLSKMDVSVVPEPPSAVLAVVGLFALALLTWRLNG
jgi:hypothetical protein